MANKKGTTSSASSQAILQQDGDWVREVIRRTVQEVLEEAGRKEAPHDEYPFVKLG